MYIHNYQIHNVLDVYRKELSKGPGANHTETSRRPPARDKTAEGADQVQRRALMDQVSLEIVDRIAQSSPQHQFEEAPIQRKAPPRSDGSGRPAKCEAAFTYTTIDENDRKTTNTLSVQQFQPLIGQAANRTAEAADGAPRKA